MERGVGISEARACPREKNSPALSVSSLTLVMAVSTYLCSHFLISSDQLPTRQWSCKGDLLLLIKSDLRKTSDGRLLYSTLRHHPVHLACGTRLPCKQRRQQNGRSSFASVHSQSLELLLRMNLHNTARLCTARVEAETQTSLKSLLQWQKHLVAV